MRINQGIDLFDFFKIIYKHGKHALLHHAALHHLHVLLLLCWKEGTVPQDMRYANIVTLYKNKCDRSDCNNYRGISLLSVVGKVFARVALTKLQILQNGKIHNRRDILCSTVAREMSRTKKATVYCFH